MSRWYSLEKEESWLWWKAGSFKLRTEEICMGFITYSLPELERHTHKVIKPFPTIYSFIRYSCTL